MKEKLKKWCMWLLLAVFWFGVAVTFVGGCFNTFFYSTDSPHEKEYEPYLRNK